MDVSRVKAVIAYDGSKFQGFQRQSPEREATEGQSVTGRIEEALASIGIREEILGAGRTDAGVSRRLGLLETKRDVEIRSLI